MNLFDKQAATCATCISWAIAKSPLKAANMAPCDLGARWTYLVPQYSCARYSAIEPPLFAKRQAWFERIMKKPQGVTK